MVQPELFDFVKQKFSVKNKIRLIELFGGVGAQSMALRDIGADFEHYRLCEFDKYPVASYNAIHGTDFIPSDIRLITGRDLGIVDVDKFTYILTYSFPCQDLSVAGKQAGMKKDSGTRSGLLWEVERLLNETESLPQVLLMENVPQVIAKKNIDDFNLWLDFLKCKGYSNYYKVLNAKDYGIAQNRNRCYMVSLLGDYDFEFPEPVPLETRLVDYLEDEVEDKYYINSDKAKILIEKLVERGVLNDGNRVDIIGNVNPSGKGQNGTVINSTGLARAITTEKGEGQKITVLCNDTKEKFLENIYGYNGMSYAGGVWDKNALSPTLRTMQGGGNQPHIICAMRGRNPDNPSDRTPGISLEQRLEPNTQGISNTLTSVQKDNLVLEDVLIGGEQKNQAVKTDGICTTLTSSVEGGHIPIKVETVRIKQATKAGAIECEIGGVADFSYPDSKTRRGRVIENGNVCPTLMSGDSEIIRIESDVEEKQRYRLRKLTPRECWRLMGFTDADFDRAASVNSNSQLYKEAGNSIVKTVLMAIFRQLDLPGVEKWNKTEE